MKTANIIFLLTACMSGAASGQWQVGLNIGQASTSSHLNLPDGAEVLALDDTDTSLGIEVTYEVLPGLLPKIGYVNLGDAKSAFQMDTTEPDSMAAILRDQQPALPDGFIAGVSYRLWQQGQWQWQAGTGLFIWDSEVRSRYNNTLYVNDEKGIDYYLETSVAYAMGDDIEMLAGYRAYTPDTGHIDQWMLGVRVGF